MQFNKSSGQVSRVLIIMGIVILLAAVVVYFGIKFAAGKKATNTVDNTVATVPEPPKPVYDVAIGEVQFTLVSARDLGNLLVDTKSGYHQNISTTEKFIQVVITAQNTGKMNTEQYIWSLGNIVDSDGRIFNQIGSAGYYFQPNPDWCGAILKPDFTPKTCVRIYEVAKGSNELKVQVNAPQAKGKDPVLLDLYITK